MKKLKVFAMGLIGSWIIKLIFSNSDAFNADIEKAIDEAYSL